MICQGYEGHELVQLILLKAFANLLLESRLNAVLQHWHLEDLGGSKSGGVLAVGLQWGLDPFALVAAVPHPAQNGSIWCDVVFMEVEDLVFRGVQV